MENIFLIIFFITVLLAVFNLIFSDFIDGLIDSFVSTYTIIFTVASFSLSAHIFTKMMGMEMTTAVIISVIIAILVGVVTQFAYTKTMKNSEVSSGFSLKDLEGKEAEVLTTIPSDSFGEVLVKNGLGFSHYSAKSYNEEEILEGATVVVVEIIEGTLYVSPVIKDIL